MNLTQYPITILFLDFLCNNNSQYGTGSRGYLVWCSMTSCLQNSCYGNVKEQQYSWVDINWPVMVAIEVEVVGRGAVSWYDDILQAKESTEE